MADLVVFMEGGMLTVHPGRTHGRWHADCADVPAQGATRDPNWFQVFRASGLVLGFGIRVWY